MIVDLNKIYFELEERRQEILSQIKTLDEKIAAINLVLVIIEEKERLDRINKTKISLNLWYPFGTK